MTTKRALKLTHLVGTAWFVLSAVYILALALHLAGFHGGLISSSYGHSALGPVSFYLVALVRARSRAQHIKIEHRLTTSPDTSALAGLLKND